MMVEFEGVPFHVERAGTKMGLIVIQEWWGLNQQIKNMTAKLAKKLDAIAITPDLYRGKVATKPDEANHLMASLDWHNAIEDVRKGVQYLKSQGIKKVGITGFCMGGALVIAAGVHVPELSAGSCFYGIPPKALADPKDVKIPLQFHFGNKDHSKGFSDNDAADALKAALSASGKDFEFHQYDADHAFMNEEAPAYPYNASVAEIAMANMVAYFEKQLA